MDDLAIEVKWCLDCSDETSSFKHSDIGPFHGLTKNHELTAVETGNCVDLADGLFDAPCRLDKQSVAGTCAEAVIDRFEPVDVDHQQRGPQAVVVGNVESMLEQAHEGALVVQTGERVVACFPSPACLFGHSMGVVGDDDHCALGVVVCGAAFKWHDRAVTWKRGPAVGPEVDAVCLPPVTLKDRSNIVLVK